MPSLDSDSSLSLAPVSETASAIIDGKNVPIISIKCQGGCPVCLKAVFGGLERRESQNDDGARSCLLEIHRQQRKST